MSENITEIIRKMCTGMFSGQVLEDMEQELLTMLPLENGQPVSDMLAALETSGTILAVPTIKKY